MHIDFQSSLMVMVCSLLGSTYINLLCVYILFWHNAYILHPTAVNDILIYTVVELTKYTQELAHKYLDTIINVTPNIDETKPKIRTYITINKALFYHKIHEGVPCI